MRTNPREEEKKYAERDSGTWDMLLEGPQRMGLGPERDDTASHGRTKKQGTPVYIHRLLGLVDQLVVVGTNALEVGLDLAVVLAHCDGVSRVHA